MKKNISINISGIIFHIEEDGYDKLKNYLDSITEYFSSFTDSKEIISDIESRIAEIFLGKLNDEKQIITLEDIEKLIATMGKVEDFQAIEDPEEDKQNSYSGTGSKQSTWEPTPPRDLKRDNQKKLLGGVCAGIGYYFNVDPLWIRLLSVVLLFITSGIAGVIYLILWAVLPSSDTIESEDKYKKMFRNPEDKVIAGVSSGVASYFGVDVSIIRILFVLFIFAGGTGLIAYLVLWIILPEATSITQKVQMKGEPITLSNIESNVKKGLNVGEGENENLLVKILLFPFRLIATIINGLGRALGPIMVFLVEFIRVVAGIFLTVMGLIGAFAVIVATGIITGLFSEGFIYSITDGDLTEIGNPFFMIFESIPEFTYIVAFLVAMTPAIFVILLGISIISKRIVFSSTVGWTLFGIFVIGGIYLGVNIPGIVYSYHEEGRYEETRRFPVDGTTNTLYLKVDDLKGFENYHETDLWLTGHEGSEVIAELEFTSRGMTREEAAKNARDAQYGIVQNDSILTFDYNISLKDGGTFKFQELDVTLSMPYNQPFVMERAVRRLLSYRSLERYGYRRSQIQEDNRWMITENGLECMTCDRFDTGWNENRSSKQLSRLIDVEEFSSMEINSPVTVQLIKGDTFKVEIRGDEDHIGYIETRVTDGNLDIRFTEDQRTARNFTMDSDDIKVYVTVPEIFQIEVGQASMLLIDKYEGTALEIELNGASSGDLDVKVETLHINLNGASKLKIRGTTDKLAVDVNGGSDLDAYRLQSKTGEISAHGASVARVNVSDTIQINRDMVSTVRYRGGAQEVDN